MTPLAIALSVAAACLAFWPGGAAATILIKRDLRALLREADLVFKGEVERVRAEEDASGQIWTLYDFGSVNTIAGARSHGAFSVRCLGGQLNGIGSLVVGTPQYEVGDRVLVFYREDDDVCQVAGWEQGSFRVISNAPNAAETLINEDGQQVVGLSATDFVLGGKLPGWQRRTFGDATSVELDPASGQPRPIDVPAGGKGAAAADFRTLEGELKAMARSLGKNWRAVTRPTVVAGRVGALDGTHANGAQR